MKEPCFSMMSKAELEKLSTVQLIRLMRKVDFQFFGTDVDCGYNGFCQCEKACKKIRTDLVMTIYEILKSRPHIPNKIEAKKIRQLRATKKIKMVSRR